jgi:HK97 family phage portal protein
VSWLNWRLGRRTVKLSNRDDAETMLAALTSGLSSAGKAVTPDTTLNLSTAWRCVRLRARVIGSLPINVYERLPDGDRRLASDHWLHGLVHESPNADQTPAEFWGAATGCVDLWGNAYARKEKIGGRTVALTPLRPDLMVPKPREAGAPRRYRYHGRDGDKEYGEDDILHLRGFTLGGDVGLSAVEYGRHTLGLSLAADETAAKTFENGLQLSGFLKAAPGSRSTKEQREELIDLFAKFAGSKQSGKVLPLPDGWDFVALGMKPEDAQLLQSRAFNVEEICRWFDTPPILAGHASQGQTMWGTGIGQIMLGWLIVDLDPFFTAREQAIEKQLLSPAERGRFYVEHNREALLQADSAGKAAFLSTMTQNGLMSRNEGRAKLNLGRRPDADDLTCQSNLVPVGQLGKTPARATQPAPGEPI